MKTQALSVARGLGTRFLFVALVATAPACGDDDKDKADTRVDATAETTAETSGDAVEEATPDVLAETTPDAAEETTADTTADVAPDTTDTTDASDTTACTDDCDLACEVVIVGGGAGGLHTAFRLAPTLGDKVCLFEKEAQLGGRIKDVALDPDDPNAPRVGVGARRVMETQQVLFDLADELGIALETPDGAGDLIAARDEVHFSKEEFVHLYPGITPDPGGDTETMLYDALRFAPERANAKTYADFPTYGKAVVGEDGWSFLRDMSRFRADFEYALDAEGYLDYLDEEWDVCCTPSYPVGGMSSFIRGMEAKVLADGGRIFKGEPVSAVAKAGAKYTITTSKRSVTADKVVLAVPPRAFDFISGDVADRIKAQDEFKAIIGVKVVTVTQWWDEDWWTAVRNPDAPDTLIWRAWTTEHCLNFVEIPIEPYAAAGKVTRSVYNDNLECSLFWEGLAALGEEAVEAELETALTDLYNNGLSVPADVAIPQPLKTYIQIWPDAWHWIRGGTPFTNKSVFDWSIKPLGDEPVALVGEAYNVRRSGWSDGAYKSSIRVLNETYGMSLPDGTSSREPRALRRGAGRQGGH